LDIKISKKQIFGNDTKAFEYILSQSFFVGIGAITMSRARQGTPAPETAKFSILERQINFYIDLLSDFFLQSFLHFFPGKCKLVVLPLAAHFRFLPKIFPVDSIPPLSSPLLMSSMRFKYSISIS
jgi:hypothetical protein